MQRLLPDDAPFPLRVILTSLAFAFASFLWFPVVYQSAGPLSLSTTGIAMAIVIAGAAAFGALGNSAHPLAPMRASLLVAIAGSFLLSISMRASATSASSHAMAALIVVLAISANLLAVPRPRVAFGVLAGLAVVGAYLLYAVEYYITSPTFSQQAKSSGWLATMLAAACITAAWHGRRLARAR